MQFLLSSLCEACNHGHLCQLLFGQHRELGKFAVSHEYRNKLERITVLIL